VVLRLLICVVFHPDLGLSIQKAKQSSSTFWRQLASLGVSPEE